MHRRCTARGAADATNAESLQASLLAAKTSATAFGLLRSVERATVATTAATVVASALVAAIVIAMCEAVGRRAEIARLTRRPGTVFRDVQTQLAPAELATVKLLDRLSRVLFIRESNECESSRAPALTVLWDVNVNDLTDLTEELA
ncbi:MAG: hypothetical protein WCE62_21880 [Polyangiales bacterium]